ncbi:oxidoreductase [Flexivirga endophytica]|uniref:Oxidoreductase n=1 Tax=Flexivirga endophytica TaxID=1849103 RepID=A0A916T248_9MICO|nr:zinc-binding dehydrogenase [Flexivirga endophytica]GGB26827.1 oxidoreductase [Flexivirga endophytica]GHB55287.1 oxidoreductase [Flexivirga endophytica]
MQAVVIRKFGDADGMVVEEAPAPVPGAEQVEIAVAAIGVGGVDAVIRRGTIGGFAPGLIPGSEVAGEVVSVGPGVDPTWIGRRVWAFVGVSGGYAERVVAHVDDLTAVPDGLSPVDAVALGSAATVAHFALAHAHFTAGDRVLVRGAAGSLGIATVELAVHGGASVVAVTTSSAERGRRLRELGATHVLDRAGAGESAADEYDVIVDIVGGADLPLFLDKLAPNGRLVLVGAVAGYPPADFGMRLVETFQASRTFSTFSLNTVPTVDRNDARAALLAAGARGDLTPVVQQVMPLAEAADAHRAMDAGTVFGRVVLVV